MRFAYLVLALLAISMSVLAIPAFAQELNESNSTGEDDDNTTIGTSGAGAFRTTTVSNPFDPVAMNDDGVPVLYIVMLDDGDIRPATMTEVSAMNDEFGLDYEVASAASGSTAGRTANGDRATGNVTSNTTRVNTTRANASNTTLD